MFAAATAAACAHAPASNDTGGVRGCWIARSGAGAAVTMRWLPDAGGGWRGERIDYAPNRTPEADAFVLKPAGGGWTLCPQEPGLPHGPPCRPAHFGTGAAPGDGGGWFELHAGAERLRFLFRTSDATLTLFDGARDGCD